MNPLPFSRFLESGVERGGFGTDDVLAALLPLLRQTLAAHREGRVAPLDGIEKLFLSDGGFFAFASDQSFAPRQNIVRLNKLQQPASGAVEVVGESRRTADVDLGSLSSSNLDVAETGGEMTRPVYLPGYRSWEQLIGQHDALTDIFSLGMLLASLSCGLDFTDPADLELFAAHRTNLFSINRRLHPVVASVIVQMSELNRRKRAQDLAHLLTRLESYRDQPAELDLDRLPGFKESTLSGRRRLIQSHLRERLFEISRRNRLIYFKPTLQTLNLTVASVPLILDYRNVRREQLLFWHPALAASVSGMKTIPLGNYLRFEDAPYIPGVLDKIISDARRDRTEFGFSQLRLVICFLRWNNLKEEKDERIQSPLLLVPVELIKKKGIRDHYVLQPVSHEAEVNPALRQHFKELYNLQLPEAVDLKAQSLDEFHAALSAQIRASEPAVTLNKIDQPQIELIHERARQRLDQYRRRLKKESRRARWAKKPDYSYERERFRPLGLEFFLQRVRPTPMPMREAAGADPEPHLPHAAEEPAQAQTLETERRLFALSEGENRNPYSWDFDLCNVTLGNFNYRKMTLVRDYENLIESDMASTAFDALFSLSPKPAETIVAPIELKDQHLVIPCDATQASAIARARTNASYIIQGPPGTGKSQTITNLIADYVARGKRVLFVCEKRAAIDVVFHRLRQQGLDELCCLIHDSQTDRKAFIQDLKQTYEKFLSPAPDGSDSEAKAEETLRAMEQELAGLRRFSEAMERSPAQVGLPLRRLLRRLVELRERPVELAPALEEALPPYALWPACRETLTRLQSTLTELGEDLHFARHPLRSLGKEILDAERPLEILSASLDQAEGFIDAIENARALSRLPPELAASFGELRPLSAFAARAHPLAGWGLLDALSDGSVFQAFEKRCALIDRCTKTLEKMRQKTFAWRQVLSPQETEAALLQARGYERSLFRIFSPGFWRLSGVMSSRYDFSRHAVRPPWSSVLEQLAARHKAEAECESIVAETARLWRSVDPGATRSLIGSLRADLRARQASVRRLFRHPAGADSIHSWIEALADIAPAVAGLDGTLRTLLPDYESSTLETIASALSQIRERAGQLGELLPVLKALSELPSPVKHALRHADLALPEFEAAIGHKSLTQVYRDDRAIQRFDGRVLADKAQALDQAYREWLALNARLIRLAVRKRFQIAIQVSSQPASQLGADEKALKKIYSAGRRELEHEFGKSMRYRSIRDLAAGNTGQVIRDLKPIWLMSPLSVSDTLPLDPMAFDVVIFDEASQIPLEAAVPALYRSHQMIVVGDEMQLPPTTFFAAARAEEENVIVEEEGERFEMDLDSDSFLAQSSTNLPSTLLAWHYRSRYESLISFSNAAFYSGELFTVPDRARPGGRTKAPEIGAANPTAGAIDDSSARAISFHFMTQGIYRERRNPEEATYIAERVRQLLQRGSGRSIGVVAFSEAQQTEIEEALARLGKEDPGFAALLEAEYVREQDDQACGLFVKNLENVQGDERDIIILSVCYARDPNGRMLMNFGPINQRGGEKRLNVIFSRAKHHMAVVSSIRHHDITNEYNDGANSLKNFLKYAEAISNGDELLSRNVLESLNPAARKTRRPEELTDAVMERVAQAVRSRGYEVELNVGRSQFRCDLAVRKPTDGFHQLAILIDNERHYANPDLLDRYYLRPSILRAFGWRVAIVLTKDWYHDPDGVLIRIERLLRSNSET